MDAPTFDYVRANLNRLPVKELEIIVVRVQPPGNSPFDLLTPIPPDLNHGLSREAVIGRLKKLEPNLGSPGNAETEFGPEDLIVNPFFTNFLQEIVARFGPEIPEYKTEARQIENGWLYVTDGRTKSSRGFVPVRDVLGAFAVRDAAIVTNSYHSNDHYVVYSEDGFTSVHKTLNADLMEELLKLNANPRQ